MNKTSHIELPLYEGDDVVKYLTIYNETMEKIDESVYALQSALASESADVSNLSDNLKKVVSDLEKESARIDTLVKNIANLESANTEQNKLIADLQKNLITANATIKEHTAKFSEIETEISETSTDLSAKISKVARDLTNFVDEQTTKNTKYTSDIRDLESRVTSLENQSGEESNYKVRVKSFAANSTIEWNIEDISAPPSTNTNSYGVQVLVEGKSESYGTMSYGTPNGNVTNSDSDFDINIERGGSAQSSFYMKISGTCTAPVMVIAYRVDI